MYLSVVQVFGNTQKTDLHVFLLERRSIASGAAYPSSRRHAIGFARRHFYIATPFYPLQRLATNTRACSFRPKKKRKKEAANRAASKRSFRRAAIVYPPANKTPPPPLRFLRRCRGNGRTRIRKSGRPLRPLAMLWKIPRRRRRLRARARARP